MTEMLVLLTASGLLLIASIVYVRWGVALRLHQSLAVYELHFSRDLDDAAVLAFVTGLTGLLAWRRRMLINIPVMFETAITATSIRYYLITPRRVSKFVLGQLSTAPPQVAAVEVVGQAMTRPSAAADLAVTSAGRQLRLTSVEATSRTLLGSYGGLGPGQSATVQWIITPHPPVGPVKPAGQRRGRHLLTLGDDFSLNLDDAEAVRAARAKQSQALFLAVGRIGVRSAAADRGRTLLRRLIGAYQVLNAPGVRFRRRAMPSSVVCGRLVNRTLPLIEYSSVLNASEAAAVVAWPIGNPDVPGLSITRHRQFRPSSLIPTEGRLVAQATYPGQERALALSVADSLTHSWIAGPTGTGKSTLLGSLLVSDLAAGRGVVLLDPKGDLAAEVLDRVPGDRIDQVIHLDPSDDEHPVGLNVLAGADRQPELVADQVLSIFHHLWHDYWGPRSAEVLHSSLLTLARQPGTTLVDLPLLLTHDGFRRQMVAGLDDFVLQQFWAAYEVMSPAERGQFIAAPMNRLRQLLVRPRLRAVLGQATPTFTMDEVINQGKILIVSLPVGSLGDEAASLIGSLVTATLWQGIQHRAAMAPAQRRPVMVFIDEVQRFVHSATDLSETLVQARGLGAGFHLAHQHVGQLPGGLRDAISANCRSKIAFQTAPGDASAMARELGSPVMADDLAALPAYEVVATLAAGGQVAPPVSGRTLPLGPATGNREAAQAASRARYGRDRAEVEAAIRARQEGPKPDGSTMRRKRGAS